MKLTSVAIITGLHIFCLYRGMPLYRKVDRSRKWRRMEDDESVFVYREGTLEQTTYHLYHADKSGNEDDSVLIRVKGKSAPITCIVPLKDIIVA